MQRVEEQVFKVRMEIQMKIDKEIHIGKKAFKDAIFERDVLKDAQRRVQEVVQAERLEAVCTEYEPSKFNQAVAVAAKKLVANIMKSSIVNAPSYSLSDKIECLIWAFHMDVRVKQIMV